MHTLASIQRSPNSLSPHYAAFRVADRLLLTGHSHQAWPDCAAQAQLDAFRDAAEWVDDKWSRAFAKADEVRRGFARLLGDSSGAVSLGASTHELLVRFLSALPLAAKPRILTTDGEFHSMRRQLGRLSEEGIAVERVAARPVQTLADRMRLALARDAGHTSAVMLSTVLFETAEIVPHLALLAGECERQGVPLLLDAYHQLNVVPMSLAQDGLEGAYVVGGGYKYCQLGEGNAFLRLPADCRLRPVVTGWYAEFGQMQDQGAGRGVAYGDGPERFGGATYDPTSHYRGAAVLQFFGQQGLTPQLLRDISQHQVGLLAREIGRAGLDERLIARASDEPLAGIAGFLALRAQNAAAVCGALKRRGVVADHRGPILRLGPAPYLSDRQLADAAGLLAECVAELAG